MIFVVRLFRHREGGTTPPPWLWISLGICNFACSYGIIYWCETILPSGLVAVLWGIFPLFMAIAGHIFLPGEQLRPRQWLGISLGFVGVILLFLTDVQNFGLQGISIALLCLLSPLVTVIGTTLVKRFASNTSSLILNRNAMAVGAGVLWMSARFCESTQTIQWTWPAIASIFYLAIMGTIVTFSLYFWLMRFAPAYQLSLISYIVPMIALGLGWAVGDEPMTLHTLAGACLAILGVALVVVSRTPAKP